MTGIEDVGRGCDALRAFSLDWLGCTHANGPDRRFVWRWSRAVNPVLPLPNSGRLAAVYLVGPDPAAAPDVARRERLRLELLPLLAPGRDDARSLIIAPATVTPRQADAPPDRPDWTLSGSWLVYPVLAARVGPSGQDGLALFRTTGTQSGRPQLELALAIAPAAALAAANPGYPPGDGAGTPVQLHWHMERWRCPLPPALAGAGADIARGAEGGADPHLRYAVTLRLERGAGQADAFAIALRRRTPDRMITSPDLAHALVLRDEAGWRTEVGACQGPLEF